VNAWERRRTFQFAMRMIVSPTISYGPKQGRPTDPIKIAERFRAFRTSFHFSQRELAGHLGISRQALSQIENCHTFPHEGTWDRFEAFERKHREGQERGNWSNWTELLAASDLATD